jgi:hypothetical protein
MGTDSATYCNRMSSNSTIGLFHNSQWHARFLHHVKRSAKRWHRFAAESIPNTHRPLKCELYKSMILLECVLCYKRKHYRTFIRKRKNLELLMNFVKLTRSCSFLAVIIHSWSGILYYSMRVYMSVFNILWWSQNDGFLNLLIILIFAVFHSTFIQDWNSRNWNRLLTST